MALARTGDKRGGCYHCGSPDHRARNCPVAVCRICGQVGHDKGGCPLKPLSPVDLGRFQALDEFEYLPMKRDDGFTYIELFCGMGGFRVALDKFNGKCVFASEVDRFCRRNYEKNFGDIPAGDITRISTEHIPNRFDILVGGFPCQPFSSSNGNRLGVDDASGRGVLFREIVRILSEKQPRAFLIENVRGLYLIDDGHTLKLIIKELKQCGYRVKHNLLDAVNLLPQERIRLYFVGIRLDLMKIEDYKFPSLPNLKRGVEDIVHDSNKCKELEKLILNKNQISKVKNQKYTLKYPEARFLSDRTRPAKTIQSSYMKYMVGSQFISAGGDEWRRFSSREVARLQGFPESFELCKERAHHMIGNAVSPPIIAVLVASILQYTNMCKDSNIPLETWGWEVTKSMLIEAAPNDSRKRNLERKLTAVSFIDSFTGKRKSRCV